MHVHVEPYSNMGKLKKNVVVFFFDTQKKKNLDSFFFPSGFFHNLQHLLGLKNIFREMEREK